jgi:O-antigen/teichoic acid export membrane protein
VGLFVLATPLNHLLRLYEQSADALRILAIGIVFSFIDNTFIATLLAMNRQTLFAKVAIFGLVFNVILDLTLIPSHGYLGAATATVATEAALVTAGWWCLRREGVALNLLALGWKIVIAAAVMGAVLTPIRQVHGVVLVAGEIVLGALVYGAALLLLRTADADEWGLIRRALRR